MEHSWSDHIDVLVRAGIAIETEYPKVWTICDVCVNQMQLDAIEVAALIERAIVRAGHAREPYPVIIDCCYGITRTWVVSREGYRLSTHPTYDAALLALAERLGNDGETKC